MKTIELSHTRVFQNLWSSQKRVNLLRGGARSSKTFSVLQTIAYWLITGYFGDKHIPKGGFSVVRETLPSLRATAYREFIELLQEMDLYFKIDHRKTALEFWFQGRHVDFFPADDANSQKIRGRQHTMFYLSEANTVSFEVFNQMIMRTEHFAILDYNPAGMDNWVYTELEQKRMLKKPEEVKLDVSTYFDNPHLPQAMVDEIEGLKDTDTDLYKVYSKGEWIKSRNLVFENVHLVKTMPEGQEFYGVDFGYNDPTVAVRVVKIGQNIYVEELVYERQLTLKQMATKLKRKALGAKLYCDNEPRTIRELKSYGVRTKAALKGKDSIRQGLNYIRTHKIHILESSLNVIREFRAYKYELDKDTQKPTDKPLDKDNHAPDAVRYALNRAIRKGGGIRI